MMRLPAFLPHCGAPRDAVLAHEADSPTAASTDADSTVATYDAAFILPRFTRM